MCSKPFSTLLSSFWGRLRSAGTAILGSRAATNTPSPTTATNSVANAEGLQEGTFRLQEILGEVLKDPVEQCPEHPMSALKAKLAACEEAITIARAVVRERQSRLKHARESTNMIKLEKALARLEEK